MALAARRLQVDPLALARRNLVEDEQARRAALPKSGNAEGATLTVNPLGGISVPGDPNGGAAQGNPNGAGNVPGKGNDGANSHVHAD